jgi:alpha-1,2-mannosyltransferase
VQLYVYPPILADMLVPLVMLPEKAAEIVWISLNFLALLLTAVLFSEVLEVRMSLLALALASSCSVGMCILWGQVTIILLLLWTVSLVAYARGRLAVSAFAIALATSIKLTPLIVVAPFLLWHDWKWLRSYALSLAALFAVMCAVNRPAVSAYLKYVIPAMSRGVANTENKSIGSSVRLLYASLHGSSVAMGKTVTSPSPHAVLILGAVLALVLAVAVLAAVARAGRHLNTSGRLLVLSMLALVSTCVAPVSWRHAYVVAFLPLAMLWTCALRERPAVRDLALLTLCTLELGSFVFDTLAGHLVHGVLLACTSFLAPTCALVLALYFLRLQSLRTFSMAPASAK